jgi:hypothetical protein
MSIALVILVLQTSQGPLAPDTDVLKSAAQDALGDEVSVTVRNVAHAPSDNEALAMERTLGADALAEISWLRADPPVVALHVHAASPSRWIHREIRFSPADVPADASRTIGFAIASMVPDAPRPPLAVADSTSSPPPPAVETLNSASLESPRADGTSEETRKVTTYAIDVSAVGATSLRGAGAGLGGTVGARWYFARHVGLRAAASLRSENAERAEASSVFADGALGVTLRSDEVSRFSFGARSDLIVGHQQLSHGPAIEHRRETEGRWVPGADLVLEGAWSFARSADVTAGAGAEALFGRTDVVVHGHEVEAFPIALLLEVGVRAKF